MEERLFAEISAVLSESEPDSISAKTKCDKINIAKSEEFVVNSKEQKIHVRSYWPKQAPKAAIVYLHGYVSHNSRPVHKYVARTFTDNNFAYITFDFHGHGYSEGVKAHIEEYIDLVDDVVSVLLGLFAGPTQTTYTRLDDTLADRNIPFFLMGHSMGGSVAILTASFLNPDVEEARQFRKTTELWRKVRTMFRGCILLCPALVVHKPPPAVLCLLNYMVTPFFPQSTIPNAFEGNSNTSSKVWNNESYAKYAALDQYPSNPTGLGWGLPMRFQTASSMLACIDKAKESIPNIYCPFVVMHDPNDTITLLEGTDILMRESNTPTEDKFHVPVADGLHDLIANKLEFVTRETMRWADEQLLKSGSAAPSETGESQSETRTSRMAREAQMDRE